MIIEDGTGVPNANSYNSLTDAINYFGDRAINGWFEATVSAQTAALILATDYIEQTYEARLPALVVGQGLQFPSRDPRALAVIKRAAIVLAYETLSTPLSQRIERGTKKTESKLDGVGMEIVEFDPAPILDHYPQLTAMLASYATPRASGVRTGRVTRDPGYDPSLLDISHGFGCNGWAVFGGWDSLI